MRPRRRAGAATRPTRNLDARGARRYPSSWRNRLTRRSVPSRGPALSATQPRTRARHQKILDAALEVFTARGYREAVVDEIASEARTSKGGVYFHFPGKQAIFLALLDRTAALLLSKIADRVASEPDPIAKVDAGLLAVLRTFASHRTLARLFLVEGFGAGPEFHAKMLEVHGQFIAFVKRNLDEAVATGVIAPLDTAVAAEAWFGALNQIVTRWVLQRSPTSLEDSYESLRALFLRSIGLAGERGPAQLDDAALAEALPPALAAGAARARQLGRATLVSVTHRVPWTDPLRLFDRARALADDRWYWDRPLDGVALVGIGAATELTSAGAGRVAAVRAAWAELLDDALVRDIADGPGPALVGGFCFDPRRPPTTTWRGFPPARLVLPRLALWARLGTCWLTANALVGPGDDPAALEAALRRDIRRLGLAGADADTGATDPAPPAAESPPPQLEDVRPAGEWKALVADATRAIHERGLEKVVLARAVRLRGGALEPTRALRRLRHEYPGCAVFAIARGDACFLGATPERLVAARDGEVRASCLAGTIARGATLDEDERLGARLMASAKERGEHAVVARTIRDRLAGACADVSLPDEPVLMKMRNVQHLFTPVTGRLAPGADLLALVERLHPTPAVGGHPLEAALAFIREREGLDRGWYAAPVGWLDRRGEGDFSVAIRSALVRGDEALLFAGCGIVADSDPEAEYAESQLKLRPMLAALDALD